jgi:GAF domain-containing protein
MLGAPHGYIYLLASDGVAEHPLSSSKPFFKGSEGKGTDAEMQMRVGTGAQAEFVGNRIQRGMGLAGQVWESGQPLVVNDYQNWPSRLGATQAATLRAVVGVPLIAREQVIGVLGLAHTVKGQTFSEAEVEVLRRFAPLAAIAIENARLFAETQTTLDETAKLYEASRRLASADNLQEVIAAVVESVPNAALNRAVIMMVERDASDEITGGEIIANWYSGHGNAPAPIGTCYPGEAFRVAQVLLSKEPVFLNDLLNDARINPFAAQIFSQQKVRALAVLPLWFSGRPFGMLILQAEQPQAFAPEVIRPYLSLTQQMAVSIENLRLIEQTRHSLAQAQQLAQREQIVSDVAERLHKAADVRRIMRLAAQEAQRVTGSPRVVVRLAPARKANEQSP